MSGLIVTTPYPISRIGRLCGALSAKAEPGPSGLARIRVGPDADAVKLRALTEALGPLRLTVQADSALSGIALDVGDRVATDREVELFVPQPWRRHEFAALLPIDGTVEFLASRYHTGRRPSPAALMLAAAMPHEEWTAMEQEGVLRMTATGAACAAIMAPLDLHVTGDENALLDFRRYEAELRNEGWRVRTSRVETAPAVAELWAPPGVVPGVAEALGGLVVEVGPAARKGFRAHLETCVRIVLPRAEVRREVARNMQVLLRTDAPDEAAPFVEALRAIGATSVDVSLGLTFTHGFAIRHTAKTRRGAVVDDVERLVDGEIKTLGFEGVHRCNVVRVDDGPGQVWIEVDLPRRAAREGRLLAEILRGIDRYHVKVGNMAQPKEMVRALEDGLSVASGLRARVGEMSSRQEEHRVAIGGAPWEIANEVARIIEANTGVALPVQRVWSSSDNDIWAAVPPGTRMRGAEKVTSMPHARSRMEAMDDTFIAMSDSVARIGTVTLPRRHGHPLAPSSVLHAHTCVDGPTGQLLAHLAMSIQLREPVLLEGPTAAGKTSGVLFLASMLGQPVVRVNLSGQTDTGELIGRYAPSANGWAWQEGVIPSAMRNGWWVVLDEVNLAEPAIIERLNPVLERIPALLVTEGDGTRFGPGGLPVAAGFHVFATMNPADGAYAGRNCLSPALRDRFTAQLHCPTPSENDVRDLLMQLVYGRGPDITVGTTQWRGATGLLAPHAILAEDSRIGGALATFARFHASIEAAAGAEDPEQRLGGDRREGIVVSRRALLAVLDYLCWRTALVDLYDAMQEAIERYYVSRVATEPDRVAIRRLAHAAGFSALRRAA